MSEQIEMNVEIDAGIEVPLVEAEVEVELGGKIGLEIVQDAEVEIEIQAPDTDFEVVGGDAELQIDGDVEVEVVFEAPNIVVEVENPIQETTEIEIEGDSTTIFVNIDKPKSVGSDISVSRDNLGNVEIDGTHLGEVFLTKMYYLLAFQFILSGFCAGLLLCFPNDIKSHFMDICSQEIWMYIRWVAL